MNLHVIVARDLCETLFLSIVRSERTRIGNRIFVEDSSDPQAEYGSNRGTSGQKHPSGKCLLFFQIKVDIKKIMGGWGFEKKIIIT